MSSRCQRGPILARSVSRWRDQVAKRPPRSGTPGFGRFRVKYFLMSSLFIVVLVVSSLIYVKQSSKAPHNLLSNASLHKLFLLEKKVERGEIDQGLWIAYFPDVPVHKVPSCEDCQAFNVCRYNHDLEPIECFSKRERHSKEF